MRQVEAFRGENYKEGITIIEQRKLSKSALLENLKKGDVVVCVSIESVTECKSLAMLDVLFTLINRGATLHVVEENLTFPAIKGTDEAKNLCDVWEYVKRETRGTRSDTKCALVKDLRKTGSTKKYGRNGKLLTYKEIAEILQLAESRELSYREIGERYGVTRATIYNIRMRYAEGTTEHEEMLKALKESE